MVLSTQDDDLFLMALATAAAAVPTRRVESADLQQPTSSGTVEICNNGTDDIGDEVEFLNALASVRGGSRGSVQIAVCSAGMSAAEVQWPVAAAQCRLRMSQRMLEAICCIRDCEQR